MFDRLPMHQKLDPKTIAAFGITTSGATQQLGPEVATRSLANVELWKNYTFGRQRVAEALRHRRECPWASDVAPGVAALERFSPYVTL
jgi:hypothetical protein